MENDTRDASGSIIEPFVQRFLTEYDSLKVISASRSTIVDVKRKNKSFILKIIRLDSSHGRNLASEAKWIDYLSSHGMSVPSLVRSVSGNLVETLGQGESSAIGYCYEKIPIQSDSRYWSEPSFIRELGRSMGRMHQLARSFNIEESDTYPSWDSDDYLSNPDRVLHPSQGLIIEAILSLKEKISSLDKSESTFGLIHDDLHSGNVFRVGTQVVILDFECLHKSWFLADIASALLFSVWIGPDKDKPERREKAKEFLRNLLTGYAEAHDFAKDWHFQMPLFLRLREIRLYTSMFSGLDIGGGNQNPLFHYVYRSISEDRPILDLDYAGILR